MEKPANTTLVFNLVSVQTTAFIYAEISKKVVNLEAATLLVSTVEKRRLPEGSVMSFGTTLGERRTAIYKGSVLDLRVLMMSWVREGEETAAGLSE